MYLTAVLTAFKEFLQEEAAGNIFAEIRLMNKIKSAQTLFSDDKKVLDAIVTTDDRLSSIFYRLKKKNQK